MGSPGNEWVKLEGYHAFILDIILMNLSLFLPSGRKRSQRRSRITLAPARLLPSGAENGRRNLKAVKRSRKTIAVRRRRKRKKEKVMHRQ